MAKQEYRLTGDLSRLLKAIDDGILGGSVSASLEEESNFRLGDARCAVRVYERYSTMGGNRLSLNVTALSDGDTLLVSAITAGGSQAMFFKINTWGNTRSSVSWTDSTRLSRTSGTGAEGGGRDGDPANERPRRLRSPPSGGGAGGRAHGDGVWPVR